MPLGFTSTRTLIRLADASAQIVYGETVTNWISRRRNIPNNGEDTRAGKTDAYTQRRPACSFLLASGSPSSRTWPSLHPGSSSIGFLSPWYPFFPPRRKQIKRRPGESRTEFKDRFRASIPEIIKQSLLIARWRDWQCRNSILDSQLAAVPHFRRICLGEHLEAYDGSARVVPGQGKRRRDGYDSKAYWYGVDDGRPDLVKRCRVSRSEHRMSLMDMDSLFLLDNAARDECEGKQIVAKVFQFSFPVELDATVPICTFTAPQQTIDSLASDVSIFAYLGKEPIATEADFLMGTLVGLSEDVTAVPSTPVESLPPLPLVTVVNVSSDVSPGGPADTLMSLGQLKPLKPILKNGRSKANRMAPYARKCKIAVDVPAVHGPPKTRESVLTLMRKSLPQELRELASPGDLQTVRDRMLGIVTCDIYGEERQRRQQGDSGAATTADSPMNGCVAESVSGYSADGNYAVVDAATGFQPMAHRTSSDDTATGTFEPMVLPSSPGVNENRYVADDVHHEPQQHVGLAMGDAGADALYDGDAVPANDNIDDLFGSSSSSDSVGTVVDVDEPELQPSLSEQIFGNGEDSDIDDSITDPRAGGCTRADQREQLGLEFDQLFEAADNALPVGPVEDGGPIDALLSIEHLSGTEDGNGSSTTLDDDLFGFDMADDAPNVISGD
ncbi:hypothetical protein GLOTRDRAFT_95775 [Gloeophyllum trabeum ATCC 11539]|uniref:Uncharacterized protein n=1 Tax=Gloeophyllum trabeum (strain ATCC 11539 / FP-39264 / Madison 617) TaxID=670483 RepID=S7RHN1_GLOTA|nr:uncharacterized protein GLOTRDRAFT_95775 [Gloeophyllum trabeum ATCC 11539]EPQ52104.1 hypothetical protein GLOTRDRAFT_95775 [Gloeophyllum trabeum ATCC 11539]